MSANNDALGRQTLVLHPGTTTVTAYTTGLVAVTAQRGHVKRRGVDGYGRTSRVEEADGAAAYPTKYVCDVANALTPNRIRIRPPVGR